MVRFLVGDVSLKISLIEFGPNLTAPISATFSLTDDSGRILLTNEPATIEGGIVTAAIAEEFNLIDSGSVSGARCVKFEITANGQVYSAKRNYLLSPESTLVVGSNSVMTHLRFLALYDEMPLSQMTDLDEAEQIKALSGAYKNICKLPLVFSNDAFYEAIKAPGDSLEDTYEKHMYLSDFDADKLAQLSLLCPKDYMQICQAQMLEAEGLAGGYPVEDRRRADMISESSGESARFFRTSRPVRLPVYRATIEALTGLVNWAVKRVRA